MSAPHAFRRAAPAYAVIGAAALVVGLVRPVAAERFHRLRVKSDVYPLAPPEDMVVASLGYRSALAGALFASVLVSYGLHFQENRRFEFVGEYLDTINALDPTFREPYRFADTLLVMAPEPPRLKEYLKAREILERGMRNLPYDTELWLTAGQYLTYLAPMQLADPKLRESFRLEGAKVLARACELTDKNANVPYNCVTAGPLLERVGEREAAIESMRRLLAVTDDPHVEKLALGFLREKLGERERDLELRRKDMFRAVWKGDLPFISKDMMLILGPSVDTAACAGAAPAAKATCATTFRDWAAQVDPSTE